MNNNDNRNSEKLDIDSIIKQSADFIAEMEELMKKLDDIEKRVEENGKEIEKVEKSLELMSLLK